MKNSPRLGLHTRIRGEYRAVLNEGTDREVDTGWRPNMILDAGLDMLGTAATNMIQYCCVGTSSTAVSAGQTALGAYLASSASGLPSSNTNAGPSTYATAFVKSYLFTLGGVVGNITEFGVTSSSNTGTLLFSRCLMVDGVGTPTALTVTAADQLTVYYRITITPVVTDLNSSVTISGTGYAYVCRLSGAASWMNAANTGIFTNGAGMANVATNRVFTRGTGGVIGSITGSATGGTLLNDATSWVNSAYTNGNFYRDSTITWLPAVGNATGGVKTLEIADGNGQWAYQWQFTTQIPKDNTKTLTMVVRISWSR